MVLDRQLAIAPFEGGKILEFFGQKSGGSKAIALLPPLAAQGGADALTDVFGQFGPANAAIDLPHGISRHRQSLSLGITRF